MNIQIATLNTKGMATPSKFKNTATLLKSYKNIDIFTLQELNITSTNLKFITKKWLNALVWTTHTAILINNPKIIINNTFATNKRALIIDLALGSHSFRIETVYLPPDRRNRLQFLETWQPSANQDNYILTGDFNTNIFPQNRMASTQARPDSSRDVLLGKLDQLIDTQVLAAVLTMQTFSQNTRNNNILLTKLDYIFLSTALATHKVELETLAGNSDHLLLVARIKSKNEHNHNPQWKLNSRTLRDKSAIGRAADLLNNSTRWD